jgi:hypothetical protein
VARPSLIDAASRSGPVAKKKWIQAAIPESHKGVFKAKAKAAGESTRAFAEEKKDAPGKTGAQARLALTLMGLHGGGKRAMKYKSMGK